MSAGSKYVISNAAEYRSFPILDTLEAPSSHFSFEISGQSRHFVDGI